MLYNIWYVTFFGLNWLSIGKNESCHLGGWLGPLHSVASEHVDTDCKSIECCWWHLQVDISVDHVAEPASHILDHDE